jgi:hypothetical protein
MKNKTCSIFYVALILACVLIFNGCKQSIDCTKTPEKVYLLSPDQFVTYKGNEQLKFLHNNLDTQIFIGQGKETYFVSDNAVSDLGCAKDHQSLKVNFLNSSTNEVFLLKYEFDNSLFSFSTNGSPYTFYKLTYKNKTFYSLFYESDTNTIYINSHPYQYVRYIGSDTNNYIAYGLPTGILRIRVNNETWDLIP